MLIKTSVTLTTVLILVAACQPKDRSPDAKNGAENWTLTNFSKADSLNPILEPSFDPQFHCPVADSLIRWEARNVLNPTAVVKENKIYLIYRAQDNNMTSRLGLAISNDGLHFEKQSHPILYPQEDSFRVYEWPGGVEDPRIVESEEGMYVLTYTAYDGKTARLCLATSTDLINWTKHGLVIKEPKYRDYWSKSGAIVGRLEENRIVATKIDGKYWMYFGDTNLFMATSEDLIHWQLLKDDESGAIATVLHPRKGYFDSRLVEPGPYGLINEFGILLIYNASNAANLNDADLAVYTYAAGQALFDKSMPYKLLDRTDNYFIHPEKPFELEGEVNKVCFVEGLANFQDQWLLYYGTADSKIGVAVSPDKGNP